MTSEKIHFPMMFMMLAMHLRLQHDIVNQALVYHYIIQRCRVGLLLPDELCLTKSCSLLDSM